MATITASVRKPGPRWTHFLREPLSWAPIGGALILGAAVGKNRWLHVVVLIALSLVLLWPVQVTLGLFALLVPFDTISVVGQGEQGTTLTFVVGGATALVLLLVGLGCNRLVAPPRAARWWILFIAWSAATTLWAIDPEAAWQRLPTALGLLLLYLVAVSVRVTATELSWVSLLAIVGGCAASLYAVSQFYSGVFYGASMRGSLVAGNRQDDPNQFAVTLLLPVSLALGRFVSTRGWMRRAVLIAAVSVMGLGVFVTMSRGALLALFVVVGVYLYRLRAGWRAFVPVCFLFIMWIALPELFFTRLQDIVGGRGAGRLDIWLVGLAVLRHHGFVGAGLSNFPVAYDNYAGYASVFQGFGRGPHNIYLGMLVEVGVVGFLLFLAAARSQLREFRHSSSPARKLALLPYQAACYGTLASGFFLDLLWRKPFWLCWILLAIATRLTRDDRSGVVR